MDPVLLALTCVIVAVAIYLLFFEGRLFWSKFFYNFSSITVICGNLTCFYLKLSKVIFQQFVHFISNNNIWLDFFIKQCNLAFSSDPTFHCLYSIKFKMTETTLVQPRNH